MKSCSIEHLDESIDHCSKSCSLCSNILHCSRIKRLSSNCHFNSSCTSILEGHLNRSKDGKCFICCNLCKNISNLSICVAVYKYRLHYSSLKCREERAVYRRINLVKRNFKHCLHYRFCSSIILSRVGWIIYNSLLKTLLLLINLITINLFCLKYIRNLIRNDS